MFLNDTQIQEALKNGNIILESVDKYSAGQEPIYKPVNIPQDAIELRDSRLIQSSSLDLHIGRIFIPPSSKNKDPNSVDESETGTKIQPGGTVVVETLEKITFSKTIGGFGFPPAGVSQEAILMTNPGHVDPGYSGHLSFTLINMGRNPYSLQHGKRIASLLLFTLSAPVEFDYNQRHPSFATKRKNYSALLSKLSPDFANWDARMNKQATKAVNKRVNDLGLWKLVIPAIITVLGFFLVPLVPDWLGSAKKTDLQALRKEVEILKEHVDIDERLDKLEMEKPE